MVWALVVLLAVVQGITEFLPVSSSGHLRVLAAFFGVKDPQTLFDVMLHVGTLAAVFFVYRTLFGRLIYASYHTIIRRKKRFADDPDARLVVYTCIAMVPTGVIGLTLASALEARSSSLVLVGSALIVNGFILLLLRSLTIGRRAASAGPRRGLDAMTLKDALIIGTAQGFGAIRGISRSGSTITAGLMTGLNQEAAASFSFLLSVPAILGALVLQLKDGGLDGMDLGMAAAGAVIAAVVGTLALLWLLKLLRKGQLHHFAWYCFALGLASIAFQLTR